MPSHKDKKKAKRQARLDTLNPTTLNVPIVSSVAKPTPEAAAAAASQRPDIWPAAAAKEASITIVTNDEVLEARKTEWWLTEGA